MTDDSNLPQQSLRTTEELANLGQAALDFLSNPLGTVPADAVGVLGGDLLHQYRIRNLARLFKKTEEILRERGVTSDQYDEISPRLMGPLLQAASDESDDTLREMWARLLANAADPNRDTSIRASFSEIVQALEPVDALFLSLLFELGNDPKRDRSAFERKLMERGYFRRGEQIVLSVKNLDGLGLLGPATQSYLLTELGLELMRAVEG